jgi:rare lipoprotein A (peptidoglycan hydrolase)
VCRTTLILLCSIVLLQCAPHPIYRSDGTELTRSPALSSSRQPPKVITPATTAHPADPAKISTKSAYQVGVASYYGKKFHGKPTANGEIFNMYKLTAAHRVLPLGTRIKVTHLGNGRWVEVKVNDRGPFIEGRILDLSFAAALELEMVKAGTAKVMIELVDPG